MLFGEGGQPFGQYLLGGIYLIRLRYVFAEIRCAAKESPLMINVGGLDRLSDHAPAEETTPDGSKFVWKRHRERYELRKNYSGQRLTIKND